MLKIFQICTLFFYKLYLTISAIGYKDGFISSTDFSNQNIYPIISTKLPSFLDYRYGLKKTKTNKNKQNIKKMLKVY